MNWVAIGLTTLFISGGYTDESLGEAYQFNFLSGKTKKFASMLTKRHAHGLAIVDDVVYTFGGYCLNSLSI